MPPCFIRVGGFKKCLVVPLLFLIFFGVGKTVDAATYYVTNAGNDNCDGTSDSIGVSGTCAWQTLTKVNASSFSPGDNIYFKRGDTWFERLLIPSSGSLAGGYITFGAYGTGNKPVFDGTGVSLPLNHGLIRGSTKNYIIVENIRVQNVGVGDALENSGIGFYSGNNIIVQDNEVSTIESAGIKMNLNATVSVLRNDVTMTNCNSWSEQISLSGVSGFEVAYNDSYTNCGAVTGGSGIDVKAGSTNGTIHHNNVWDIGTSGGANGIYVDAWDTETSNIKVYSNYVRDIGAVGIMIGSEAGGALHNITVHHNIVERAARGGIGFHDQGTTGDPVYDIYIYNNTLYFNGTNGINYYGGVRIWDSLLTGVTFKNNILSNAYNFQIGVDGVDPGVVTLDHNVIFGVNVDSGGFTHLNGTNTISVDPLYVDAGGSDFHLQSSSPARNACDNSVWQGVPNITDYDGTVITDDSGNIVVAGGTVSCGALEYVAPADVTPPVLSTGSPTGILSAGTSSVPLSLSTDENATCKYSTTSDATYASMANTFTTTGGTVHSQTLSGLTAGAYSYYVRCSDGDSNVNTSDYVISFSIDAPPTNITLSNSTIDENLAINTVVGALSTTDPDVGDTHTYSLSCSVPGADDSSFNISGANLRSSAIFDYETKSSYVICVRTDDGHNGVYDKSFTITVNSVTATTYYVTNAGNDNCDGTSEIIGVSGNCAWKTLAKVSSRTFSAGDNIYFRRGDTWNEQLIIKGSGTAGNPITFGAYGTGNKPVFDGTGVTLTADQGLIRAFNRSYITVSDIRVQNAGIGDANENVGIDFYGGTNIVVQRNEVNNTESAGIKMNTSSNVGIFYNDVSGTNCNSWSEQISLSNVDGFEIAYNKSHDTCPDAVGTGGSGIDAKGGSRNGTIHHNEVYNITTPLANGIYVDAYSATTSNIQVYNNYVHDITGGAGLAVGAESGGSTYDITFHHNIVENARHAGMIFHDQGTTGSPIYNIYVYNNTFYQNGTDGTGYKGGVRIFDSLLATDGATFKNNIFTEAYNFQIGYDATRVQLSDIIMDYNLVYGASNSGVFTPIFGTNAITSNPLLTNASAGDFSLQSSSPARNACDNSVWQGVPNITDYDGTVITDDSGNIVVAGGTVSCGALEYVAPADVTPPVLSTGSPTGILSAGTSSVPLSLSTDENSICRYSTNASTSYSSMTNTFYTTGGTSHTTTVSGLANGNSYNYYVRCSDGDNNVNTSDYVITFSVASATVSSGGGGSGSSSRDTTPPRNTSILINNGDSKTASSTVKLTLTARDEDRRLYVQISEMVNFSGAPWQSFTSTFSWTFSQGNGLRTLYARFKDSKDNVSETVTDSIILEEANAPAYITPQVQPVSKPLTQTNGHIFQLDMGIGTRGNEVVELQKRLRSAGFFTYPIDTGYYGPVTAEAVKKYQAHHGVSSTGYVGPLTRAELNKGGTGGEEISIKSFVQLLITLGVIPQEKAELALSYIATLP